jgi:rubredoxin
MHNKKPVPLLLAGAPPRRLCPVCGVVSYSREGVHPQCAQRRADAPRMESVKASREGEAVKPKGKAENSSLVRPWHKRCPECQAQLHLRKMTCVCGYQFDETR